MTVEKRWIVHHPFSPEAGRNNHFPPTLDRWESPMRNQGAEASRDSVQNLVSPYSTTINLSFPLTASGAGGVARRNAPVLEWNPGDIQ